MKKFNNAFKTIVERKFICFIKKSIIGIKKDFYRKEILRNSRETLLADPENQCNDCVYNDKLHGSSLIDIENSQLLLALNSLTPRQLEVIFLLKVNDFTETEVAELFNISQQSINKTKSRALIKLRKFYQGGNDK